MPHVAAITEVCVSSNVLKQRALQTLGSLPPFSPILNRLMATLAGDNVSFSKLGDLMEKDTVIAGNLLSMVNSALYARRGTVNSVRHALTLLGIEKVRNAVLGMSLSRMWSKVDAPLSWSMARFDMHSAAVAILSDMLAQKLPVAYPEGAFVAGLLHDLGRLLIAIGQPSGTIGSTPPSKSNQSSKFLDLRTPSFPLTRLRSGICRSRFCSRYGTITTRNRVRPAPSR
jgi:hypothetical protein